MGRAQSHWEEEGNSREMIPGGEAVKVGVVEEVMGSLKSGGADPSVDPAAPRAGWPGSTFPVWGAEEEQLNPSKENQLLKRSWRRFLSEELGQICSPGSLPSLVSPPASPLSWT